MIRSAASKVMWAGKATMFYAVVLGVLAALVLVVAAGTKPAEAAFPGNNGKIAFTSTQEAPLLATGTTRHQQIAVALEQGINDYLK